MMDAGQILKQWEECLNRGDLKNILALYANDAVLWGTFSKVIHDNADLIQEYFQNLLQKKSLSVSFSNIRHRVYDGVHLFSGIYEFFHEHGEPEVFPARFTFVICKVEDEGYRIVEHHSSLIPD